MEMIKWTVTNRVVTAETDKAEQTIPAGSILRWSKEKQAEHQSGCVVWITVRVNGALKFEFPFEQDAVEFKKALDWHLT